MVMTIFYEYTSKYHKIPDDNSELVCLLSICHVLPFNNKSPFHVSMVFTVIRPVPVTNTHHKSEILRSAAMAQVPICWLQESEKQLYWAPQSACQFHQNVHCWLKVSECSEVGVFWWCEDCMHI